MHPAICARILRGYDPNAWTLVYRRIVGSLFHVQCCLLATPQRPLIGQDRMRRGFTYRRFRPKASSDGALIVVVDTLRTSAHASFK